jgi:hypothetical protein
VTGGFVLRCTRCTAAWLFASGDLPEGWATGALRCPFCGGYFNRERETAQIIACRCARCQATHEFFGLTVAEVRAVPCHVCGMCALRISGVRSDWVGEQPSPLALPSGIPAAEYVPLTADDERRARSLLASIAWEDS